MKKLILIIPILVLMLAACSSNKKVFEDYSAYRNMTSEQLFNSAELALAKQNYSDAVKRYEALDALFPFGPYAQQGQLEVIYAYYKADDTASALAATERYIRLYPRSLHVDYAYYMEGLISYQSGFTWLQRKVGSDPAPRDLADKEHSFIAFNDLVTMFPDSPYAADALAHMIYIRNLIARSNVEIAAYYMKRKAYVAAANRASFVVEHFDGSPQVIPALVILAEAYQKLGLYELANDTLQILHANTAPVVAIHHL